MNVFVAGISYRTASVELREKFFLHPLEREVALNELKSDPCVKEAFVVSTCNRTEIYASLVDGADAGRLIDVIFMVKKIEVAPALRTCFYIYNGEKCLNYLFRVVSGLESLVIGEKQILGQLKEAVELSRRKGMLSKDFNILTDLVVRAGKKAQHETDISYGGVSVSWAAIKTAERVLTTLEGKKVLILGAGKMSALTVEQLSKKKLGHLFIMNRSREKALVLAEHLNAEAVSFSDIKDVLAQADLCICSASAPHYLIDRLLVESVMAARRQRKLVCVDISTPRNIDPQVKSVENVDLFIIDELSKAVEESVERRKTAIKQVETIISKKIVKLKDKLQRIKSLGYEKLAVVH